MHALIKMLTQSHFDERGVLIDFMILELFSIYHLKELICYIRIPTPAPAKGPILSLEKI